MLHINLKLHTIFTFHKYLTLKSTENKTTWVFDIVSNILKQMYKNKNIKIIIGQGLFQWLGGDANQLIIFIRPYENIWHKSVALNYRYM